jgi:uncharacterized protein YjbJ (UPF0337 family)
MLNENNGTGRGVNDTAGQARRGLLDSVTGKAKQLAGALTRNDELTENGQLSRAQASAQRDAGTSDSLAETQADRASEQLREDKQHAQRHRQAAAAQAKHRVRSAAHAAQAEQASIDTDAARREQAAQERESAWSRHWFDHRRADRRRPCALLVPGRPATSIPDEDPDRSHRVVRRRIPRLRHLSPRCPTDCPYKPQGSPAR